MAVAVASAMEQGSLQASCSLWWVAMGLAMEDSLLEPVLLLPGTEASGNCRPIHCFDTTPQR